ncbi:tumor necrosis factor receptor superfamily member 10A-like isoform X1 [Arapaima gigas]
MITRYMVVTLLLVLTLNPSAKLSLGVALVDVPGYQDVFCRDDMEFRHENHCCLNCPAGQFVQEPCTQPLTRGTCAACPYDTYTEHDNGLTKCLPCTKCRTDEEVTRQCSSTQNSNCQCKSGFFCSPDQACEFCKKCSKCKPDEENVKNCTTTSNTLCKKKTPTPAAVQAFLQVAVVVVIVVIVPLAIFLAIYLRKKGYLKCCPVEKQKNVNVTKSESLLNRVTQDDETNATLKKEEQSSVQVEPQQENVPLPEESPLVGAKDEGLGNSLPSTTRSFQINLSSQHPVPCHSKSPHPSPVALRNLTTRVHTLRRRLIPTNGQESLKRSFDFFEELDISYHNKFFRRIGLSDNVIQNTDNQSHADKVYELLRVWLEKQGLKADINDLIEALLCLDQRLSAENIIEKAIKNGDFVYEDNGYLG